MPDSRVQHQRAADAVAKALTALLTQKSMLVEELSSVSQVPLPKVQALLAGTVEAEIGFEVLIRLSAALRFEFWLYMFPREALQPCGELVDDQLEGGMVLELSARATNQDLVLKIGRYLCDIVQLAAQSGGCEAHAVVMADAYANALKRRVGHTPTLNDAVRVADVVGYVLQMRFMTQDAAAETPEYRAFRLREQQPVHNVTGPGALAAIRRYVSLLATVEPKAT